MPNSQRARSWLIGREFANISRILLDLPNILRGSIDNKIDIRARLAVRGNMSFHLYFSPLHAVDKGISKRFVVFTLPSELVLKRKYCSWLYFSFKWFRCIICKHVVTNVRLGNVCLSYNGGAVFLRPDRKLWHLSLSERRWLVIHKYFGGIFDRCTSARVLTALRGAKDAVYLLET